LAREHLPTPDPKHVGLTTYDAKDPNTKYPPITTLRPPQGAPNVLIVLIDDVGFGASSAFGGPCNTPVAERLAANGLKLNRFHHPGSRRLRQSADAKSRLRREQAAADATTRQALERGVSWMTGNSRSVFS
jgi:predicted alpha/beta-hydrolase family hydrolase